MSDQYVRIGSITKIFDHHSSIGFYPNCSIAKGDELGLEFANSSHNVPDITFTVHSMEVNLVKRPSIDPGEPCSVQIKPWPTERLTMHIPILRKLQPGETIKELQLQAEKYSCSKSPSSIHEWEPGLKMAYQWDDPPDRCRHCGIQKTI